MNEIIIIISIMGTCVLINLGISTKARVDDLKIEDGQLQADNLNLKQAIKEKGSLPKQAPVPLSTEYSVVLNQIKLLESYSGTSMNVQLEGAMDAQDISSHY